MESPSIAFDLIPVNWAVDAAITDHPVINSSNAGIPSIFDN